MATSRVRMLGIEDARDYFLLRRESLSKVPLAFASSLEDDRASSVEEVQKLLARGVEGPVFGAFGPDGALVGCVGLFRARHIKCRHKAHIWGMYVQENHRRQGLAFALLRRALAFPSQHWPEVEWVHLGVSESVPGAKKLYESIGFRVWGTEPDALEYQGQRVDEFHMAVRLDTLDFLCSSS